MRPSVMQATEATWSAGRQPDAAVEASPRSLFDRLGGLPRIDWLVDRFIDQIGSDPELAPCWARVDLASIRKALAAFFAEALGARLADRYVEARHGGVQFDGDQFLRVALLLHDTISSMRLPADLHAEVVLAVVSRALAWEMD